ncbi:MAG: class II aldolase/adducin family protein, partial [Deferribacterales bacterium]|nr:class II aldolase/adducin family protein [Deferribacterales bacterium]
KTGVMLDEINEKDIIEVSLTKKNSSDKLASSELIVHRMIYEKTVYTNVIHTHSLYSTFMDVFQDYVTFNYSEVLPFLKLVPIVGGKSGSFELAENVAGALNENPIVIVMGHGVFAASKNFKECFVYLTALEHYAKDKYYRELIKNG